MRRLCQTLLLVVTLAAVPGFAAARNSWPRLPTRFVNGRAATDRDVKEGRAFFLPTPENRSGQPASVRVPQYALWRDGAGTLRHVVVVQAEKNRDGSEDVAVMTTGGEVAIVPREQLKLLGLKKIAP